jgi:hypothetical protein
MNHLERFQPEIGIMSGEHPTVSRYCPVFKVDMLALKMRYLPTTKVQE